MDRGCRRRATQINVRLSEEDLENLKSCQEKLGGLSQSQAIRILMRMYMGKIPAFPKQLGNCGFSIGKSNHRASNFARENNPATQMNNDQQSKLAKADEDHPKKSEATKKFLKAYWAAVQIRATLDSEKNSLKKQTPRGSLKKPRGAGGRVRGWESVILLLQLEPQRLFSPSP